MSPSSVETDTLLCWQRHYTKGYSEIWKPVSRKVAASLDVEQLLLAPDVESAARDLQDRYPSSIAGRTRVFYGMEREWRDSEYVSSWHLFVVGEDDAVLLTNSEQLDEDDFLEEVKAAWPERVLCANSEAIIDNYDRGARPTWLPEEVEHSGGKVVYTRSPYVSHWRSGRDVDADKMRSVQFYARFVRSRSAGKPRKDPVYPMRPYMFEYAIKALQDVADKAFAPYVNTADCSHFGHEHSMRKHDNWRDLFNTFGSVLNTAITYRGLAAVLSLHEMDRLLETWTKQGPATIRKLTRDRLFHDKPRILCDWLTQQAAAAERRRAKAAKIKKPAAAKVPDRWRHLPPLPACPEFIRGYDFELLRELYTGSTPARKRRFEAWAKKLQDDPQKRYEHLF